jgi:hypothetical protein
VDPIDDQLKRLSQLTTGARLRESVRCGSALVIDAETGTTADSIRVRKTGLEVIADYDDLEIDQDAFYLQHYGIEVPASTD